MKKIILSKPLINVADTSNIVRKVLIENFPNEGRQTREFEKKICSFLKTKYAITTTSGTTAIFLALKAEINFEYEIPCCLAAALILIIHSLRKLRLFTRRSL